MFRCTNLLRKSLYATGAVVSYGVSLGINYMGEQARGLHSNLTELTLTNWFAWFNTILGPGYAYSVDCLFRIVPARDRELKEQHNLLKNLKIQKTSVAAIQTQLESEKITRNPITNRNIKLAVCTVAGMAIPAIAYVAAPPISIAYAVGETLLTGIVIGPLAASPWYILDLKRRQQAYNREYVAYSTDLGVEASSEAKPSSHEVDVAVVTPTESPQAPLLALPDTAQLPSSAAEEAAPHRVEVFQFFGKRQQLEIEDPQASVAQTRSRSWWCPFG